MPRKEGPRIDDELASRLRDAISSERQRLHQGTEEFVEKLAKAIGNRHRDEAYVSKRTVYRHLSEEPLAQKAALDLIAGCRALGLRRLPTDLVEEIYRKALAPQAILYEGASSALAQVLVERARRAMRVSPAAAERLKKEFVDYLAPYENFNQIELGKTVWFWIKSYFGGERSWKLAFNQLRMGVDVSPEGTYRVPSSLIEAIVSATSARKPRRD